MLFSVANESSSSCKRFALVNDSHLEPAETTSTQHIIILLGSAGSGKSVQSQLLSSQDGWTWLSTGKLLRDSTDASLQDRLNRGDLIEDEVVVGVLSQAMGSLTSTKTFIIDGFPRTAAQAGWILEWSKNTNRPIGRVVHLVASREVALARLMSRQRADDTEQAINARFEEYDTVIRPVLSDFAEAGVPISEISADGTVEEVHEEILRQLKG